MSPHFSTAFLTFAPEHQRCIVIQRRTSTLSTIPKTYDHILFELGVQLNRGVANFNHSSKVTAVCCGVEIGGCASVQHTFILFLHFYLKAPGLSVHMRHGDIFHALYCTGLGPGHFHPHLVQHVMVADCHWNFKEQILIKLSSPDCPTDYGALEMR